MRGVTTGTTSRAASQSLLHVRAAARGSALHARTAVLAQARGVGAFGQHLRALARAVRPTAASAPAARFVRGYGRACFNVASSAKRRFNTEQHKQRQAGSVMSQQVVAQALRTRAAPSHGVSAGAGFAHAASVRAFGCKVDWQFLVGHNAVPSFARANPSVERTTTGKPVVAAHLQRWAS